MPETCRLKSPTDGITAAIPSSALGGGFPITQKMVSCPVRGPKGVFAVMSSTTRPPQKLGGSGLPNTTPQPYGWKATSPVAVQVSLNDVPSAPVKVYIPLMFVD